MTSLRPSVAAICCSVTLFLSLSQPARAQSEIHVLEPDKSIERELKAGEAHSYQITLAASQYLRVSVEQLDIDVTVKIFGPGGRPIADVNNSKRPKFAEHLLIFTETSGEFRVEVSAANKDASVGRYELRFEVLEATSEENKARAGRSSAGRERMAGPVPTSASAGPR